MASSTQGTSSKEMFGGQAWSNIGGHDLAIPAVVECARKDK
jgi:hypothetical protein